MTVKKPGSVPLRRTSVRNQSIECCRVLAAVMVVFIHCLLPGTLGSVMDCLARFAVPFFFVVSGYFAYGTDENGIRRRIGNIVKLNIYSTGFYVFWGIFKRKFIFREGCRQWLLAGLTQNSLARWFLVNENPYGEHLWYLTAVLVCYFALYIYVRWQGGQKDYGPFYIASFVLYTTHLVMSSFMTAIAWGVPFELYRNGLLFGIPMFGLGIFLREYRDRILETYRLSRGKLAAMIFAGAALSLLQWRGTGGVEMPVGTLFEVIALMLLLSSVPRVFREESCLSTMTSRFGELSLVIYVVHPCLMDAYELYLMNRMAALGMTAEAYLRPFVIIMLSIAAGVVWIAVKTLAGKTLAGSR